MSFGFITRLILLAFGFVILAGIYAFAIEPRMILLEEVDIPVEDLPDSLVGFTIGVMADLHVDTTPPSTISAAAQRLARLDPDIAVVVGDFAEGTSLLDEVNRTLEPLGIVYGVIGNWDRWSEDPDSLDLIDVRLLVNEGLSPANGIWLCGIDDALLGYPSIDEAVADAPEGAVRILLAHEPDVAAWVAPRHKIALQISGHSHGGQVRLPRIGPVLLPPLGREYPAGLAKTPTHMVYTTRGVGTSHIPVRFLCPPEITLLRLVRP